MRKPKPLTPAQQLRRFKADARIADFQGWCAKHGLPVPIPEFRFDPKRKWRFDFCWSGGIACEVQGGLFSAGRHTRGAALLKEHEKLNAAAVAGYRVIFTTPTNIKSPAMLALLQEVLLNAKGNVR